MDFDVGRFTHDLVTEMADAVIYADAKGEIQYWNKAATRIFGFAAAEALGHSLEIIIPENLRERHWSGFDETMRTGNTRYGAGDILAVPALHQNGARISVEFTVVPFKDDAGKMVGIAAVLREVTKRFEETKQMKKRLSVLEAVAAERAKPA